MESGGSSLANRPAFSSRRRPDGHREGPPTTRPYSGSHQNGTRPSPPGHSLSGVLPNSLGHCPHPPGGHGGGPTVPTPGSTVEDRPSRHRLLRDKINSLHERHLECIRLLSLLDADTPPLRRALSKQQAATVAAQLKRALLNAPPQQQRRYVQGLVSDIVVEHERIVMRGSKAAIASAISSKSGPDGVLTSIREWRTGQDSNPRPPDS